MLAFEHSPAADIVANNWQTKIMHANIKLGEIKLSGDDLQAEQVPAILAFGACLALTFLWRSKLLDFEIEKV